MSLDYFQPGKTSFKGLPVVVGEAFRLGVWGLERYNSSVMCVWLKALNRAVNRWALGSFFVSEKVVSEKAVL